MVCLRNMSINTLHNGDDDDNDNNNNNNNKLKPQTNGTLTCPSLRMKREM